MHALLHASNSDIMTMMPTLIKRIDRYHLYLKKDLRILLVNTIERPYKIQTINVIRDGCGNRNRQFVGRVL